MTKQVLVLGGTAFVSKEMLKALIAAGYTVDFVTRGKRWLNVTGYRTHHICDRQDEAALKKCVAGICYDYVFDISGYTRHDVEVALKAIDRESLQRYVFLSSGAVYIPSQEVLAEDAPRGVNPHWGRYGLDKKEAEDYLFANQPEVPFTIFRPPYIYGEGNMLYRELFFFQQIEKGEPIPYPATDTQIQFIHIADVTQVLLHAVTNERTKGEAYHLSHPEEITWERLVRTCQRCTGEAQLLAVTADEMAELNVVSKHFFPFRDVTYRMSIGKMRRHGLPEPRIDLNTGLTRSYDWFKQQSLPEAPRHAMRALARVIAYCLQKED